MEPIAPPPPPHNPPPKTASFLLETMNPLLLPMTTTVKTEPSPLQTLPPPPGFEPQTRNLRLMPPQPQTSGRPINEGAVFYKFVTSSVLEEEKLKIPKRFVQELQGPHAFLSLANGQYWTVHIIKENNRVWFERGWHVYLQLLSIRPGIFLLFRYEGNSKFDVSVYNLNALEKLPCMATSTRSVDSGHQASCSISGSRCSFPHPSLLEDEAFIDQKPFASSQNWPNCWNHTHMACLESMHAANIASSSKAIHALALPQTEQDLLQLGKNTRRWRAVTGEEKRMAFQASQMYNSTNPFFKVTLKPSYAYKGYCLHIPTKFAKVYLEGISETITLVHDGKQWPVKLGCAGIAFRLTNGWNRFSLDNYLEEDDVCVFELIRRPHIVFSVTIFRVLPLIRPIVQIPNS